MFQQRKRSEQKRLEGRAKGGKNFNGVSRSFNRVKCCCSMKSKKKTKKIPIEFSLSGLRRLRSQEGKSEVVKERVAGSFSKL